MKNLPELIAEIGVNYYDIAQQMGCDPVQAAKQMAEKARDSGVGVVKFQTYKADKLAAEDSPAYWDLSEEPTESQRELFSKFDKLSHEDFRDIAQFCDDIGVEFVSTAFDRESAIFINKLSRRHKIASADITNIELLSLIGSFKKPILMSIGGATKEEVEYAIEILGANGSTDITLLHCVLSYPTANEKANLWKIATIRSKFKNLKVGYSDHTKFSIPILEAAWLLGAETIEKHFTLDKSLKGNDHYHAASPEDFREILSHMRQMAAFIGEERECWYDASEEGARMNARRGVYLRREVKEGEPMNMDDVIFLRPQGKGIDPIEWDKWLKERKKYNRNQKKGEQIFL